jgi:hypothetical protein
MLTERSRPTGGPGFRSPRHAGHPGPLLPSFNQR